MQGADRDRQKGHLGSFTGALEGTRPVQAPSYWFCSLRTRLCGYQTGALPQFELPERSIGDYDGFIGAA